MYSTYMKGEKDMFVVNNIYFVIDIHITYVYENTRLLFWKPHI